jgi:hypothetical protein
MQDVRRVVQNGLECAVEMGESLGGWAEAELFAEVVSATGTVRAVVAHDACLDGDALADVAIANARTDGGDDSWCFVAEDERCLEGKVTIAAVCIVVHCKAIIRIYDCSATW